MVAAAEYIETNGLRTYYQVHNEGEPLLLGPAEPCQTSAASTRPARP
jgi:hypothetical protein